MRSCEHGGYRLQRAATLNPHTGISRVHNPTQAYLKRQRCVTTVNCLSDRNAELRAWRLPTAARCHAEPAHRHITRTQSHAGIPEATTLRNDCQLPYRSECGAASMAVTDCSALPR